MQTNSSTSPCFLLSPFGLTALKRDRDLGRSRRTCISFPILYFWRGKARWYANRLWFSFARTSNLFRNPFDSETLSTKDLYTIAYVALLASVPESRWLRSRTQAIADLWWTRCSVVDSLPWYIQNPWNLVLPWRPLVWLDPRIQCVGYIIVSSFIIFLPSPEILFNLAGGLSGEEWLLKARLAGFLASGTRSHHNWIFTPVPLQIKVQFLVSGRHPIFNSFSDWALVWFTSDVLGTVLAIFIQLDSSTTAYCLSVRWWRFHDEENGYCMLN